MAVFDEIVKKTTQFVEKNKGFWDHTAWSKFVEEVQSKSVKMTNETQTYLGSMLESFKKFYENSSDAGKKAMSNIAEQTAKFVEQTKGMWTHAEWEKYLGEIQQRGVKLTQDSTAYVGEILESAKKFYSKLPISAKEGSVSETSGETGEKKETKGKKP